MGLVPLENSIELNFQACGIKPRALSACFEAVVGARLAQSLAIAAAAAEHLGDAQERQL